MPSTEAIFLGGSADATNPQRAKAAASAHADLVRRNVVITTPG